MNSSNFNASMCIHELTSKIKEMRSADAVHLFDILPLSTCEPSEGHCNDQLWKNTTSSTVSRTWPKGLHFVDCQLHSEKVNQLVECWQWHSECNIKLILVQQFCNIISPDQSRRTPFLWSDFFAVPDQEQFEQKLMLDLLLPFNFIIIQICVQWWILRDVAWKTRPDDVDDMACCWVCCSNGLLLSNMLLRRCFDQIG